MKTNNIIDLRLFSIPVSICHNFLDEEQAKLIFNYCLEKINLKEHEFLSKGKSSYTGTSKILSELENNLTCCKSLHQSLVSSINKFLLNMITIETYYNNINYAIDNSWINISDEGDTLTHHFHQHSLVTGALYINVGEKSSPLEIVNPNYKIIELSSQITPKDRQETTTPYNCFFHRIYPKIGDLILFPSWLDHGYMYTKNYFKNRMVISFNTIII
ncbi:MAG: hypothetical protein EB127_00810 [Alphaproteobacteria bacterium]|nr:hypothetical protein [Alphaproteobacteria bacterium]